MAIEKIYCCDLCRDRKHTDNLVGIYWEGKSIVRRPAIGVERHLCHDCIKSIRELYDVVSMTNTR